MVFRRKIPKTGKSPTMKLKKAGFLQRRKTDRGGAPLRNFRDPAARKKKIVRTINQIDITQKEGQANFMKLSNKIDTGFKKFDRGMAQFDKGMAQFESAFSGKKGKTKSLLDDPFGGKGIGF